MADLSPDDRIPPPAPEREDFVKDPAKLAAIRDALSHMGERRRRHIPTPEDLAARRKRLDLAKWILPSLAAILLSSIAVWPEIARWINENKEILREMERMKVQNSTLEGAVYHGIDANNRPYTITAERANQENSDRVELQDPIADTQLSGGSWSQIRADHGTYMQHEQTLNLRGHVVLYRADGTLLNGPTADIDLHQSVISSPDWVHAEGPFGILDAQGYFIDHRNGIIEFTGPQRVVRNDDATHTHRQNATEDNPLS